MELDEEFFEDDYEDDYLDEDIYDDYEYDDEEDLDEEFEGGDSSKPSRVYATYVCDDCNYRWEDIDLEARQGRASDITLDDIICPMCGSRSVTKL